MLVQGAGPVMLDQYFKKKRALVNLVTHLGTSIGKGSRQKHSDFSGRRPYEGGSDARYNSSIIVVIFFPAKINRRNWVIWNGKKNFCFLLLLCSGSFNLCYLDPDPSDEGLGPGYTAPSFRIVLYPERWPSSDAGGGLAQGYTHLVQ